MDGWIDGWMDGRLCKRRHVTIGSGTKRVKARVYGP